MKNITLELSPLPYATDALSAFSTTETFHYHYGKHHAAYVTNLNNLIKDTPMADMTVENIIQTSYRQQNTAVFNNAAQHWNHSFFWECLSPHGGGAPTGDIKARLEQDFGSVDNFKQLFSTAALKLFGAGWAWLAQNADGQLEILPLKDAHTPLTEGKIPLLTLDVWEHAYYIDYRNARNRFIEGFWEVVNWDLCNQQLKHANV